jgi:hypothetical protein
MAVASAAILLLATWQLLQVHYLFNGNWTGLFCAGDRMPLPPGFESTYRAPKSDGYDGQFYRYIAYDPFLKRDLWRYMDGGSYRYRRLLVPLLAWALAGLTRVSADSAYIAVIWFFTGLGTYCLARLATRYGYSALWGLLFLIAPATLIAGDFLTVDVALAALTVAIVLALESERFKLAVLLAACCPLCHDTGVIIPGALTLFYLIRKDLLRAMIAAASIVPAWLWFQYIRSAIPAPATVAKAVPSWVFQKVGIGIVERLLHPIPYPYGPFTRSVIQGLDFAAITSILVCLILVIFQPGARRRLTADFLACAGVLYFGLALALGSPFFWIDPNGYGRTFTVLLLLAAIRGFQIRRLAYAAPLVLVTFRVGLQQLTEAHQIWKRIAS